MSAQCRAAAAKVIACVLDGASLDSPLQAALEECSAVDKPLLQQLCYGTLRSYSRLDGILSQLLRKKLKSKDNDIKALMLCGMHQLLEMRTPDHAAISTTVEATRLLGKHWATKLVNGVLRRCSRESESLLENLDAAARDAHPPWLHGAINKHWPEHAASVLQANNSHPPMCLRVNTLLGSRQDYLAKLQAQEIEASGCEYASAGIRLLNAVDVARLPSFDEGWVSVQDEAAQLVGEILHIAPGEKVLDACSAPGGKACDLLERYPQMGELLAMDIDAERLARVEENMERLQLPAGLIQGDGRQPPPDLEHGSFDKILVDAPCSGSGVIRRHPDIKVLRRKDDIPGFALVQLELLQGLWPLLRPGGQLLYVTCSILPGENQRVVEAFLSATPTATLSPLKVEWGVDLDGCRQTLPSLDGPDGLFFALLQKNG